MPEEKLTPQQIAEKLNQEIADIKDMAKKSSTKEEVDALKTEITALREEFGDEHATKIDNVEKSIRKLTDKVGKISIPGGAMGVTIRDRIKSVLESDEWQKHTKNRAEGESPIGNIETKDISWGGAGTGGTNDATPNAIPFLVPQYPFEEPFDVRSYIPVSTVDSGSLTYPQETLITDGQGMLGETEASAETSITFNDVTETANRIGTHAIVSRRSLRNTLWLSAYLANRFMEKFVKLLNTQVLVGDGTGENLNGIITQATAYVDATDLADTIPTGESTLIDAVLAQRTQLYDTANVMANAVFVSPITHFQLTVQKTTTRDYANGTVLAMNSKTGLWEIAGMPIVMSKDVPNGDCLVAMISPTVLELLMNGGIDMSTSNSHAEIFTSSQVAFRFEADMIFPIYRPYAFIYGTLADIQTDITA